MQLRALVTSALPQLQQVYPADEAKAMLKRLLEDVCGLPWHLTVIEPEKDIPDTRANAVDQMVRRLCAGEPLQYVIGWTVFCGRRFNVAPGVLIPRPETESLCQLVEMYAHGDSLTPPVHHPKILDLCTGSGCIAWTLSLDLKGASVTALDISPEALAIASSQNPLEVELSEDRPVPAKILRRPAFLKADVLDPTTMEDFSDDFDFIVSNPPYVMNREKALMRANVLEHEPHLALFVPDEDPLLFYRAIADWAMHCLRPGGRVLVEINEALGPETAACFTAAGLQDAQVVNDLFDKARFVTARRWTLQQNIPICTP